MFSKKTNHEKIVKSNRAMDAVGDLTFQEGSRSSTDMDTVYTIVKSSKSQSGVDTARTNRKK